VNCIFRVHFVSFAVPLKNLRRCLETEICSYTGTSAGYQRNAPATRWLHFKARTIGSKRCGCV